MGKIRIGTMLVLWLLSAVAIAAPSSVAERRQEASMLLKGSIEVDADGSVATHVIDDQQEVPDYVREYVARQVAGWRFEPVLVDGQAVPVRTAMSLRMIALPVNHDEFEMSLAAAHFGRPGQDSDGVTALETPPPKYPRKALNDAVTGTVYLLLRIGRDGTVSDLMAEQVNLVETGGAGAWEWNRYRNLLADAATKAARSWRYSPPTTGEHADDDHWTIRTPVEFVIAGFEPRYGRWAKYLPGETRQAPWHGNDDTRPDALPSGIAHLVRSGLKLLTPLQAGPVNGG